MAERIEVVLTCDVHDGVADAVATVVVALDGETFDCDLCEAHLAELRRTVDHWSSRARPAARGDDSALSRRSRRLSASGGRSASDSRRAKRKVRQPPRTTTVRRAQRVPVASPPRDAGDSTRERVAAP